MNNVDNLENAIVFNNVSYAYPHTEETCLKNVDLTVERGKFIALMGTTGAGKTTLSLCLNGLIPQLLEGKLTGQVTVAGQDVRNTSVQWFSRALGLVLQDPETQLIGRTVEEDTAFGPRNFSIPFEEIQWRVNQALEKVRLNGYNQRLTEELSGGEKQRLAIAGVLVMEPKILVLDEPTSELDPVGRAEIFETLDDLRKTKDLTIMLIEHSSEELIKKADEVIVLNKGELIWRGVPSDLFRDISLLRKCGLKPIPTSVIGREFYERGWIPFDKIPLDISSAEQIIRALLAEHGRKWRKNDPSELEPPLASKAVAIQIKDLIYHYHSGQPALQGINLTINEDEFVALIGQNGAGKTTLAKHLNGLLKPTSGEVIVHSMNTLQYDTPHLSRTIGYVFQNPDHQIFSTTVTKELEYGLKNAGFKGQEIKDRVDQVLQYTGLEQYRNLHPFTLGKGERQKIAVASILVLKPKVLIIDEPTTGSDWAGIQTMMALIRRLHQAETTIIMITHDMELVAEYAQRVIVMKEGGILLDGNPREVFSNEELLKDAGIVPPQLCRLSSRLKDVLLQDTLLEPHEFMELFESGEKAECL